MYFLFGILIAVCMVCFWLRFFRRRHVIEKVCKMGECDKYCLLKEIMEPFGFEYLPEQDIMTSSVDAWQREFGYGAIFDENAHRFHMVFDCEPIYFDYDGRTWLIEFWKGQYGMNAGGEIGIYCTDKLPDAAGRTRTHFRSAGDKEMLPLSMELYENGKKLFCVRKKHWWLTGFCVGQYSEPEALTMKAVLLFPNREMQQKFIEGLLEAGYGECDIRVCGRSVCFTFAKAHCLQRHRRCSWRVRWVQWQNRIFSRIFQSITRPFLCAADRILYLYFFLPVGFRCLLRRNRRKQQKRRKKR